MAKWSSLKFRPQMHRRHNKLPAQSAQVDFVSFLNNFKMLSKIFLATTSSTNVPAPPQTQHQQIQHIDADFYEECDGPVGRTGNAQHSDLILGTALAM